jgi:RNA-binding protein
MLTAKDKRRLRQVAHRVSVVVTVGEQGVTPGVRDETARALTDHELIKARVNVVDRVLRRSIGEALAAQCGAAVVQVIGKVWVLYRPNPHADAELSNTARHS